MKRAIKFLRTALDPASAPSEVHKASIEFMRELKSCGMPIADVEGALWEAFRASEAHSPQKGLEALKTYLQEQQKEKAVKSTMIKTGYYRTSLTTNLTSFQLFDIYENYSDQKDIVKAKIELDKRGLL